MNFKHYKFLKDKLLSELTEKKNNQKNNDLAPLAFAYIGDAVFSLFVREKLLIIERNNLRVLNDISSKVVSAIMQAQALRHIEPLLSEQEKDVFKKGRNTKSSVPKSANVYEYRLSTGFECLLGWLYWNQETERLFILMNKSFEFIINSFLKENGEK